MRPVAVNVSLPQAVEFRGRRVSTSIFKEPVDRRVLLRRLGPEGDWQADLSCHGGLHKAAYAYPIEHYPFWSEELERDDLRPGQVGENLTVEGLTEEQVRLGTCSVSAAPWCS
jgi:MOSC domain-containing protein YiiM